MQVLLSLDSGAVLLTHTFPTSVVPNRGALLNDLAVNVADPENKMVYISDSDRGLLAVYSVRRDQSWTVAHSSMRADLRGATLSFINPPARLRIADNHINGLAVAPATRGSRHLYYRWVLRPATPPQPPHWPQAVAGGDGGAGQGGRGAGGGGGG